MTIKDGISTGIKITLTMLVVTLLIPLLLTCACLVDKVERDLEDDP